MLAHSGFIYFLKLTHLIGLMRFYWFFLSLSLSRALFHSFLGSLRKTVLTKRNNYCLIQTSERNTQFLGKHTFLKKNTRFFEEKQHVFLKKIHSFFSKQLQSNRAEKPVFLQKSCVFLKKKWVFFSLVWTGPKVSNNFKRMGEEKKSWKKFLKYFFLLEKTT